MKKLLGIGAAAVLAVGLAACSPPMESGVVVGKDHDPGHFQYCGKGCMMWVAEDWDLQIEGVNEEGEDAVGWVDVDEATYNATEIGDEWTRESK